MADQSEANPSAVDTTDAPSGDTPDAAPTGDTSEPARSASRLCGRCRKAFDRDPTDPHATDTAWWLCPPCHEALVGGVGRGRPSSGNP